MLAMAYLVMIVILVLLNEQAGALAAIFVFGVSYVAVQVPFAY